jgi:hypothetical protein
VKQVTKYARYSAFSVAKPCFFTLEHDIFERKRLGNLCIIGGKSRDLCALSSSKQCLLAGDLPQKAKSLNLNPLSIMKKAAFALLVCSLSLIKAFSQDTSPRNSEIPADYEVSTSNTIGLTLRNVDDKLVKRVWADYAKKNLRSKVMYDRKTKKNIAENAQMRNSDPVNLEFDLRPVGNDLSFSITFPESGANANIPNGMTARSANNDRYQRNRSAREMLEDFAKEVEREKIRLEAEEQEKILRKYESDLERLQNQNTRYRKDIEEAEEKIRKSKEAIIQNEKDQEAAQKLIQDQKRVVDEVKRKMN